MTEPSAQPVKWYRQKRWIFALAGVIVLLIGIGIGSAGNKTKTKTRTVAGPVVQTTREVPVPGETATVQVTTTATATVQVTTTYTPVPQTAFDGDGTYLVGKDIQPGVYRSATPDGGNCYSEVDRDGNGTINSIITNDNSAGQTVLTVPSGAYQVSVHGCSPFTRVS